MPARMTGRRNAEPPKPCGPLDRPTGECKRCDRVANWEMTAGRLELRPENLRPIISAEDGQSLRRGYAVSKARRLAVSYKSIP